MDFALQFPEIITIEDENGNTALIRAVVSGRKSSHGFAEPSLATKV